MSSYDLSLDHDRHLILVVIRGELMQDDGSEIITVTRQKASELNYNILYDMREATTNVPFSSWYRLPRELEVFSDHNIRRHKAVLLVSKTDKALKGYEFYSIVTENLGIKVRVFFEPDEALEWLTGKSPAAPPAGLPGH
ncbi:MAG: hypothetical protein JSS81_21545 [Acidobacteria bacterium]|nr:hypothetical protein [Acidobacteriota bacterium]